MLEILNTTATGFPLPVPHIYPSLNSIVCILNLKHICHFDGFRVRIYEADNNFISN